MKGLSHPTNDIPLNPSANESIRDVIARVPMSRRRFLGSSASAAALAGAGGLTLGGLVGTVEAHGYDRDYLPGIGFTPVPATRAPVADRVTVPPGYKAQVFVAWGDPIMPGGKAFTGGATETAADQLRQFGMHNDGMHFFPFAGNGGRATSDVGLLAVNNEYTHEEILFPDGQVGAGYTIAKTRKSQAAHGVSIVEARRSRGKWAVNRNSRYGRRITANTPMRISGPAAGHALMQTREFEVSESGSVWTGRTTNGRTALGTVNNCANGYTPWGTYLTCEENWNGNFGGTGAVDTSQATEIGKLNNRYGVTAAGFGYRWHTTDPRWDVTTNPNEPHHFGWVVEIDPYDPRSTPVKRTALGRFKHESAQYVVDDRGNVAFYMGDDERNEYIYKFVCSRKFRGGKDDDGYGRDDDDRRGRGRDDDDDRRDYRNMLDDGILYVARFDANLTGEWIPLVPGTIGLDGKALRDNPNFTGANDAEVLAKILIKTRMAADAVGATMMDRPEWTGARPRVKGFREIEVYCTLTNNNRRGTTTASVNKPDGSTAAGSARPPVDAANPREDNVYGHIIRWREAGRTVTARTFSWDIFVQAGDTKTVKPPKPTNDYKGNIVDVPRPTARTTAPPTVSGSTTTGACGCRPTRWATAPATS